MEQNNNYKDLLRRVRLLYKKTNEEMKALIEECVPEVLTVNKDEIKDEIMIYLDWLDGKRDCAPRGEYSIQQMVKYIRNNLNVEKEQKPVDVKPIFNVGDYIISNDRYHRGFIIRKELDKYILDDGLQIDVSSIRNYRLWKLKDAVDGDIIVSGQITLIFKEFERDSDCNFIIAYAGVDVSGNVQITNKHWLISNDAKPATDDQKKQFLKKLFDAGYIWNRVNKLHTQQEIKIGDVVKSVEYETLWIRTENRYILSDGVSSCNIDGKFIKATDEETKTFFKNLNEHGYRYDYEKKKVVKKGSVVFVSSNDFEMIDKTIWKLQDLLGHTTPDSDKIRENIKWLKDFKERASK